MSINKITTLATLAAAMVFVSGSVVENQGRTISGKVVEPPSGFLSTVGTPVANARVEYLEDGAGSPAVATTDASGNFSFPAGQDGILTASKSGLTTISIGWTTSMSSSGLRIELPSPATLRGRVYDMGTRRNAGEALVSVMVDHSVNPRSAAVFTTDGTYSFDELPPGPAVVVVQADGFAPNYTSVTLTAGGRQTADVGLLLDGIVVGTVVNSAGDPVTGATVNVAYDGFNGAEVLVSYAGGYILTDNDGGFRVNGVVPNQGFVIDAELDGQRSSSQSLTATPGIPIENVVLRFN